VVGGSMWAGRQHISLVPGRCVSMDASEPGRWGWEDGHTIRHSGRCAGGWRACGREHGRRSAGSGPSFQRGSPRPHRFPAEENLEKRAAGWAHLGVREYIGAKSWKLLRPPFPRCGLRSNPDDPMMSRKCFTGKRGKPSISGACATRFVTLIIHHWTPFGYFTCFGGFDECDAPARLGGGILPPPHVLVKVSVWWRGKRSGRAIENSLRAPEEKKPPTCGSPFASHIKNIGW